MGKSKPITKHRLASPDNFRAQSNFTSDDNRILFALLYYAIADHSPEAAANMRNAYSPKIIESVIAEAELLCKHDHHVREWIAQNLLRMPESDLQERGRKLLEQKLPAVFGKGPVPADELFA